MSGLPGRSSHGDHIISDRRLDIQSAIVDNKLKSETYSEVFISRPNVDTSIPVYKAA